MDNRSYPDRSLIGRFAVTIRTGRLDLMNLLSLLGGLGGKRPKRLLWILNHKTLLPAEVPIIESFGLEVFTPGGTPTDAEFVSASGRHHKSTSLSPKALRTLEQFDFYTEEWPQAVVDAINSGFDVVVTAVYPTPLVQALTRFKGPVLARVFGREGDLTYDQLFQHYGCAELVRQAGDRFLLAQAYANIQAIEPDYLARRAVTIGCAIPETIWRTQGSWRPTRPEMLFICPRINAAGYYRDQYEKIVGSFAGVPRTILGAQPEPVQDDTVIGYVDDEALFDLYRTRAGFAYISEEPRHIHYTPLEAIIVGMPVLFRKGSMLSLIAGERLAGECASLDEMAEKAGRIVAGDQVLIGDIKARQDRLLAPFTDARVRGEWGHALAGLGLASG